MAVVSRQRSYLIGPDPREAHIGVCRGCGATSIQPWWRYTAWEWYRGDEPASVEESEDGHVIDGEVPDLCGPVFYVPISYST